MFHEVDVVTFTHAQELKDSIFKPREFQRIYQVICCLCYCSKMKVYVIGSSHINHLQKYLNENYDMQLANHVVLMRGISGGHVSSMYKYLIELFDFKPDLIFVQIGSNDISDQANSVRDVVFAITHFCETVRSMLASHACTKILVGMLFHRSKVWTKFNLSVEQYNQRVMMLNDKLQLESSFSQKYVFWKHRGLQFPSVNILKDGTHLNNVGNWRLATSLRGAIIFTAKHVLSLVRHSNLILRMHMYM